MSILGIIPARFASTRFPGKPLVDILGRSMIRRVYEQASLSSRLNDLLVATDDMRIFEHVIAFGGKAILTSSHHQSGTDRCAEVLLNYPSARAIINIQGDEPLLNPIQIDQVAASFDDPETQLASLIKKINDESDLENSNVVKVVRNASSEAIYFSRSPIPFLRGKDKGSWLGHQNFYKHIGIYGYRRDILERISTLKPSFLELSESLEQLRWLENGFRIRMGLTEFEGQAVDTPEDLQKIISIIAEPGRD